MRRFYCLLACALVICIAGQAAPKYVGGDISLLTKYEEHGAIYYNENGTRVTNVLGYLNQVRAWVNSALAEPPRQCDVGNAKEQYKRFYEMCFNRSCTLCHYKFYEGCSRDQCFARWEQTLYEKGGAV